mmetsp:Transcript_5811/g.14170  ORF Transcript_5811/g.14170 Transcript_5811/m.14170 type:complete len:466 (+) Transcript_5811:225-1622(+)|eukprot:CAMPEP_0113451740 /NCGR_PEP_ID=MMETSP0014_2-20120614/6492_1 /TAXON_ID=2857 /ORGANISM="Nitzschia sp." /LENGTH=465 /DNA_ID=CAMNT_0000343101 /DNA_START=127 /DNA_END=1524 /DNA_ORIENTATION=- /assembly_acc=CAM_ASM_000159
MILSRVLVAIFTVVVCFDYDVEGAMLGRSRREMATQRGVYVQNNSGRRIDVLWVNVHADPETLHSQNGGEGYAYGGDQHILSYVGHTFEVQELPSKKTGKCQQIECRKARFTVNDQENQHFTVDKSFQITHEDDRQKAYTLAQDIFDQCQKEVLEGEEDTTKSRSPAESIEAVSKCVEERVNETMEVKQEERDFQSTLRMQMAEDLIPYACGDNNFTATQEVQNVTFPFRGLGLAVDGKTQQYRAIRDEIRILHHRPTSEISMIENFTTPEQCKAIEAYLNKKGTVPFQSITEKTTQGIQLESFAQKMYSLARVRLQWDDLEFTDMDKLGIPLLESSIYDGETIHAPTHMCVGNKEDYEKDRLAGKCRLMGDKPLVVDTKKLVVEKESQLAQFFLFCEEPDTLGALYFPYAGVYVKPQVGKLVMSINRRLNNESEDDKSFDGYVTEAHLCPNHHLYMHTIEQAVA